MGVVGGMAFGLGIGWESSNIVGASIDIGPGLISFLTILTASVVQISIATLAYFTAKSANKKADESKDLAHNAAKELDSVKETVVLTEKLVNQQHTDAKRDIKERDEEISEMKLEIAHLKQTIVVERTMAAAPAVDPPAEPPMAKKS